MKSKRVMVAAAALMMILASCRYGENVPRQDAETRREGEAAPARPPWISSEDAVERYMADVSFVEEIESQLGGGMFGPHWVTFFDFDFDGVLEAVVAAIDGSALCRWSRMYAIEREGGNVKTIPYDNGYGEGDMMDYTWDKSVRLLRDERTGDFSYIVEGFCRDSSLNNFIDESIGIAAFSNSTVFVKELGSQLQEREGADDDYRETFNFMGHAMPETAYRAELDRYLSNFKDLHLMVGICEIFDQKLILHVGGKSTVELEFTKDNLRSALLWCYKTFSYDGLSNP